jgi:hypothetical protein
MIGLLQLLMAAVAAAPVDQRRQVLLVAPE